MADKRVSLQAVAGQEYAPVVRPPKESILAAARPNFGKTTSFLQMAVRAHQEGADQRFHLLDVEQGAPKLLSRGAVADAIKDGVLTVVSEADFQQTQRAYIEMLKATKGRYQDWICLDSVPTWYEIVQRNQAKAKGLDLTEERHARKSAGAGFGAWNSDDWQTVKISTGTIVTHMLGPACDANVMFTAHLTDPWHTEYTDSQQSAPRPGTRLELWWAAGIKSVPNTPKWFDAQVDTLLALLMNAQTKTREVVVVRDRGEVDASGERATFKSDWYHQLKGLRAERQSKELELDE